MEHIRSGSSTPNPKFEPKTDPHIGHSDLGAILLVGKSCWDIDVVKLMLAWASFDWNFAPSAAVGVEAWREGEVEGRGGSILDRGRAEEHTSVQEGPSRVRPRPNRTRPPAPIKHVSVVGPVYKLPVGCGGQHFDLDPTQMSAHKAPKPVRNRKQSTPHRVASLGTKLKC